MTQQENPQSLLANLMLSMSDPTKRNQTISQIPQQLQILFTDRNKQFELIGQDGTQALADWQNSILLGQPMPESSSNILDSLRSKLMAMVENKPAIISK